VQKDWPYARVAGINGGYSGQPDYILRRRRYEGAGSLLDYVQKEIAAGKSVDEISKAQAVPGFPDHEGAPAGTLQMAYEELTSKA